MFVASSAPGLAIRSSWPKTRFFSSMSSEHGLDHEVALGDRVLVRAAVEQRHPLLDLVGREASSRRAALVVAADRGQAAVESVAVLLDDRYRKPGVGEGHRDAAAHRAGAEHADAANVPDRCVGGNVGNLARRTLGEEVVALCPRLRVGMEGPRQLGLAGEALVERQRGRRFDALNADLGGIEATGPAGDATPEIVEEPWILPDHRAVTLDVPHTGQAPSLRHGTQGEAERAGGEAAFLVAVRHRVDEPQFQRLVGGDVLTAGDHLERPRHTDQPRQPLSAAAARQDAQLDLGQAEPRFRVGHPEVAGHRHLEASAQGRAVDGGHERLGRLLDHSPHLVRVRGQARLAELSDVSAGDECPTAADDDRSLHLRVVGHCRHGRREPLAHVLAQRVDRWIVDPDRADHAESRLLVTFDRYGLAELHGGVLP